VRSRPYAQQILSRCMALGWVCAALWLPGRRMLVACRRHREEAQLALARRLRGVNVSN